MKKYFFKIMINIIAILNETLIINSNFVLIEKIKKY